MAILTASPLLFSTGTTRPSGTSTLDSGGASVLVLGASDPDCGASASPVPEQAVTASASTPTRAAAPTRCLSTLLISSSSSHRIWCVDGPAVYAICRRARPRKAGGGRESARREPLMPSLCIAGQKLHAARESLGLAAALRPYSTCKDRMSRSEDPCERSPDRPGRRERSHSRVAAGRRADRPRDVDALSLIHISEPTRLGMISYAVFC